jgi:hypothetical protein
MMEDDLLLEEQIKKKKRVVLLLLFSVLLAAATAAVLLKPTAPTPPTVAGVELTPPTPGQAATSVADAVTSTPTPTQVQSDEWAEPAPSPTDIDELTTQHPSITATGATEEPETVQATGQAGTPTAIAGAQNPDEGPENRERATQTATSLTVQPGEQASILTTPERNAGVPSNAAPETTPVATEISKRIHESWEVLDEYDSETGGQSGVAESATSTTPLTETMAMVPPDGLPVTGIISQRGMNWAAPAVVILLLGTGLIALLSSRSDRNKL